MHWFTLKMLAMVWVGPDQRQEPRTPLRVSGNQALGSSSTASPGSSAGGWVVSGAVGTWTNIHIGCWHLRQWLNPLYHKTALKIYFVIWKAERDHLTNQPANRRTFHCQVHFHNGRCWWGWTRSKPRSRILSYFPHWWPKPRTQAILLCLWLKVEQLRLKLVLMGCCIAGGCSTHRTTTPAPIFMCLIISFILATK